MAEASVTSGAAGRLIRVAMAAPMIGLLSSIFAISFSAIIYNGALSAHVSQGIGLTLIGATIMGLLSAFLFSYRGTISQPQDVTAILLSLAAAQIAASDIIAPEAVFPTVAMLVIVATFTTGIVAYACGRFGMGNIARFIPYPVMAGFLAAAGYLLTTAAIGMVIGRSVDIWGLPALFEWPVLIRWLPWLAVAALVTALTRASSQPMTLPVLLILTGAGFYGLLALTGTTLAEAREAGLLLGPFGRSNFLQGLSPALVLDVDWRVMTAHLPTVIGVIAMTIIGALLNATGLGVVIDREIDLNTDLKAVGLSNLAASAGGGLVGFHLLGETVFSRKMGLTGPIAGISAGVGTGLVLVFGAGLLSLLPVGLFAVVIAYLGMDLLITWLWAERRNLPAMDYGLVMLILLAAATIGFLQALTVGLLAAALLFIYSYSRIDTVRLSSTIATRRSSVERGMAAQTVLQDHGNSVHITELTGYQFFGTAQRLLDQVEQDLGSHPDVRRLIIDFTRVPEIDASAAFVLEKIAKLCRRRQVGLCCSSADTGHQARFPSERLAALGVTLYPTLDAALQAAEEALLAAHPATETEADGSFLSLVQARHPGIRLEDVFKTTRLEAGEILVEQNAHSDEMFVLLDGALVAEIIGVDGDPVTVTRFLPGTLLGEIAYYASVPRTAAIRAVVPSRVMRLDADALDGEGRVAELAQDVHRAAAGYLARRLVRTTQMLRAGGF
ncbi:SulP family inorganic anion transporter [Oceanibium sediminis]|uniref:SulP family inorganic anion transporter n=1 Tax=Oceanibium sediminis TaxID=2026339 RepID=UPI000DD4B029|nr:SulP family inorganic anion transporter [Oceanibium sediminis]